MAIHKKRTGDGAEANRFSSSNNLIIIFVIIALLFLLVAAIIFRPVFLQPTPVQPEICNNGGDDDGDGLADLNDGDCIIIQRITPNFIYNNQQASVSFEVNGATPGAQVFILGQFFATTYQPPSSNPNSVPVLTVTVPNACSTQGVGCFVGNVPVTVSNYPAGGANAFSQPADLLVESPTPGTITSNPSTVSSSGGAITISGTNLLPANSALNFDGTVLFLSSEDPVVNPSTVLFPVKQTDTPSYLTYDSQTGNLVATLPPSPPQTVYLTVGNPLSTASYSYSSNSPSLSIIDVCQNPANVPALNLIDVSYLDPQTNTNIVTTNTVSNYLSNPVTFTFVGTFPAGNYVPAFSGASIPVSLTANAQGNLELAIDMYGFTPGTYSLSVVNSNGCSSTGINFVVTGMNPAVTTTNPTTLTTNGGTVTIIGDNFYTSSLWGTQSRIGILSSPSDPTSWTLYGGQTTVVSQTKIDVVVSQGTPTATYNLVVVNPGAIQGSGNYVSNPSQFSVQDTGGGASGGGGGSSGGGGGGGGGSSTRQCNDNFDNDNDGRIDLQDSGCSSALDNNESNEVIVTPIGSAPLVACSDGVDNDNDGRIDLQDLGCESASDTSEVNEASQTNEEEPGTSSSQIRSTTTIYYGTIILLVGGVVALVVIVLRSFRRRGKLIPRPSSRDTFVAGDSSHKPKSSPPPTMPPKNSSRASRTKQKTDTSAYTNLARKVNLR